MYDYQDYKPELFKEENQEMFLKIRDGMNAVITLAGCITLDKAIEFGSGDNWLRMAMVDRLVELGDVEEIKVDNSYSSNLRIFAKF